MECQDCGYFHSGSCEKAFDASMQAMYGEDDYVPYDEDGEIAMMRVLETNEIQRWETEQEEGMIAALWN